MSGIVSEFKIGLDGAELDSSRELALQARKQGLNLSDLASNLGYTTLSKIRRQQRTKLNRS